MLKSLQHSFVIECFSASLARQALPPELIHKLVAGAEDQPDGSVDEDRHLEASRRRRLASKHLASKLCFLFGTDESGVSTGPSI